MPSNTFTADWLRNDAVKSLRFLAPDIVGFPHMSGAHVFIDRSQFPENVRRDLLESLRRREINHKFHYESYKQAAKWIALHEAYSPARNDSSCRGSYDRAFEAVAAHVSAKVHLIGLGCGGGQKEARLLEILCGRKCHLTYTASDVSVPLVLTAREAALPFLEEARCHAMVCDLATVNDLNAAIGKAALRASRVVTAFGLIPNFEPDLLFARFARLLRPDDLLLLSANLVPGTPREYQQAVRAVLPQYDNPLSRDWLLTLVHDLGFRRRGGHLHFSVECKAQEPARIVAHYAPSLRDQIQVHGENFTFNHEKPLRLFFSNRFLPVDLRRRLKRHGFDVIGEWLNDSGEEGVFLCRK